MGLQICTLVGEWGCTGRGDGVSGLGMGCMGGNWVVWLGNGVARMGMGLYGWGMGLQCGNGVAVVNYI